MSLLDNDLYAFTQQQAVLHYFPHSEATYRLFARKNYIHPALENNIRKLIIQLSTKRFSRDDLDYLESLRYFKKNYLEYLSRFRLNVNQVKFVRNPGRLELEIKGYWGDVILWETPLLAAISALLTHEFNYEHQEKLIDAKVELLRQSRPLRLAEFGTRRRASVEVQSLVLQKLKGYYGFTGTSNVWFARQFNVPCVGTNAHQWYSAYESIYGVGCANHNALFQWQQFYEEHPQLWVGLTDTFTSELFFKQCEDSPPLNRCTAYRQDSGDPIKYLKKYSDGKRKFLLTDSLTVPKAIDINNKSDNVNFAIGTSLTNDTPHPPSIVMKLISLDGKPCVKLSDDKDKAFGDAETIKKIRKEIHEYCSKSL